MSKENETATEEKRETKDSRAIRKDACNKEIAQVLSKYNCELTAQMILNEGGCLPQVFIRCLPDTEE